MKKTLSNKTTLEKAVIAAKELEIKELKRKLADARKIARLSEDRYLSIIFAIRANAHSHAYALKLAEHLCERSRKIDMHGKDIGPFSWMAERTFGD